jgi:hypothetical protein
VDGNPASAVCARLNGALASVDSERPAPVTVLCADATRLRLEKIAGAGLTTAFFDPSRRTDNSTGGRMRVSAPQDYSPPLAWSEALRRYFETVAIKVSPAIDDAILGRFADGEIEFIASRGECKEAVIWFGLPAHDLREAARAEAGTSRGRLSAWDVYAAACRAESPVRASRGSAERAGRYFATVLRPGSAPSTLAPFVCDEPEIAVPGAYLYEPDPAVIRAHLIPQIAAMLSAAWIESGTAYLTADRRIETPFASAFQILDCLPYDRKAVQRRLRALSAHINAVKKRGVPLDPIEVRKGLEPCGSLAVDLILMRRAGRVISILCRRTSGSPDQSDA